MLFMVLSIMVLVSIAFLTLLERKLLGYLQLRKGPNKLLLKGVFQPLSDGVKLFIKENYSGGSLNKFLFNLFPVMGFFLMLMFWISFNFNYEEVLLYSFILVMLISGVSVYCIMGSGWASNSKYALLGAYRSVAQTISYEVSMVFLMMGLVYLLMSYSISFWGIMLANCVMVVFGFWFLFLVWIVIILAELNRAPFDFAEGESELVSGFNVEYGSGKFALFFLAEYGNIIFMSYLTVMLFFEISMNIYMLYVLFMVVWVRGTYPRFRYDMLMDLAWKNFLPFVLILLVLVSLLMKILF